MSDMFDNAQEVAAPKKKAGKDELETISMGGIETHAAIKYAIKSLEGLEKILAHNLKFNARELFMGKYTELFESGHPKQPANFKAEDGSALTTVILGKRSVRSPLTPEECDFLDALKVRYDEVKDVEDRFIIDEAVLNQPGVREKVAAALSNIEGAEGIIKRQTGTTTYVVTDETLTDVFQLTPEKVADAVELVTGVTLRSTIKDKKRVAEVLGTVLTTDVEKQAAAEKQTLAEAEAEAAVRRHEFVRESRAVEGGVAAIDAMEELENRGFPRNGADHEEV